MCRSKKYPEQSLIDYFDLLLVLNYNFGTYDGISIRFDWSSIYVYYNNSTSTYVKNLPYRVDIFHSNDLEVINETPTSIFFELYPELSLVNLDINHFIMKVLNKNNWYEMNLIENSNSFRFSVHREDNRHILSDVKYITSQLHINILSGMIQYSYSLYDYEFNQNSYI